MFKATFGMAEIGKFPSLKDAFKAIYDRCMSEQSFPMMMFDTIWVEPADNTRPSNVLLFNDLIKVAHEQGWLTEKGKWVG